MGLRLGAENLTTVSRLVGAVLCVSVLVVGGQSAYRQWTEYQDANDRRHEIAGLGSQASLTATFLWDAYKTCRVAGTPDVPQCAARNGELPEEAAAFQSAGEALQRRDAFVASCTKYRAADECWDLLRRALNIRQNEDKVQR